VEVKLLLPALREEGREIDRRAVTWRSKMRPARTRVAEWKDLGEGGEGGSKS